MELHFRLEEERLRLRKMQDEMATLGGVGLRTYANYVSGARVPDASFLSLIASAGADVQYILTGVHGQPAMTLEQERAGYVVEVLSPSEAQAVRALRASGALAATNIQITGDGNQAAGRDLNHSQGAKNETRKGRNPKDSRK